MNTAAVNALVIFRSNTKQFDYKRSKFLKELGLQLIGEFKAIRETNPRLPRNLRPVPESQAKEVHQNQNKRQRVSSRCMTCPRSNDRKTFYVCEKCRVAICMEHAHLFCSNCIEFETA